MPIKGTQSLCPVFRTTFDAMGGVNEIVVAATDQDTAVRLMELAAGEVLRIERKYSRYRQDEDSIVHRINKSAEGGRPVTCDAETWELLAIADRLYTMSNGLFDITSGVLRRAWDFARAIVPSERDLAPLLELINWKDVELGESTIRLPRPGMEIDFGGFGKEYATDRAGALLAKHGVAHGYVNLGGDIRSIGGQPDGSPWRFGVRNPRDNKAAIANIEMTNGGLATSGDYEKFFEIDGKRYCHILNPRTGYPVTHWRSVSVSSSSTITAGALSTIAMLKESEAVESLEKSNCRYLLVDAAGQMFSNSSTKRTEQS